MADWEQTKGKELSNRLKGILEKTTKVFEELQKREVAKGVKIKDLLINSSMEKNKKKKVGK